MIGQYKFYLTNRQSMFKLTYHWLFVLYDPIQKLLSLPVHNVLVEIELYITKEPTDKISDMLFC